MRSPATAAVRTGGKRLEYQPARHLDDLHVAIDQLRHEFGLERRDRNASWMRTAGG